MSEGDCSPARDARQGLSTTPFRVDGGGGAGAPASVPGGSELGPSIAGIRWRESPRDGARGPSAVVGTRCRPAKRSHRGGDAEPDADAGAQLIASCA